MFIWHDGETEEEVLSSSQGFRSFLEGKGSMILEESRPLKKILAYPILKRREAWSSSFKFMIKPELLEEAKAFLKHSEKPPLRFTFSRFYPSSQRRAARLQAFPRPKTEEKPEVEESDKRLEEILGK